MIEFETFAKKNEHNLQLCRGQAGLIESVNEETGICELNCGGKKTTITIPETIKTVLHTTAAVTNPTALEGWGGFIKCPE